MKLHWGIIVSVSLAIVIAGAILSGCSNGDEPTAAPAEEPASVAFVVPADGAVDVPTGTNISVKFSGAVDTTSAMANFFFCGGGPMQMWLDSLDHYGGFGHMSMGQAGHMMNWIDSIEWSGRFHWNAEHDSCLFNPDSSLAPATGYMLLLYEGGMMSQDGGMMGGSGHGDDGYHRFRFTTIP